MTAAQVTDSAALHDRARDAQASFERFRLRNVPLAGSGWGGSCDELLGRLCLRLLETGDWWPGPEAGGIGAARRELLTELGQVGQVLPGDLWVLEQRAFYLAEAGTPASILPLLEPCPVIPAWWCDALAGFALHRGHRFQEAEAAFRAALASMPEEEAARWTDPRPVADRVGRELLDRALDRPEVATRFWALSDPLFLVPGNDRWTEHLARHVEESMREDARNGYGLRWGSDLAESLVRYGPEVGWEVRRPRPGEGVSAATGVGHHHPELRSYVAPGRALTELSATLASEWNPGGRTLPRSGYAPTYAPVFLPASGGLRRVPRGRDVLLIALLALPADTSHHSDHGHPPLPGPIGTPAGPDVRFGLFAVDTLGRVVGDRQSDDGRLLLRLPPGRYLVSGEVWAPDSLRAGRLRQGFEWRGVAPDVPVVSDLLLADSLDAPPADLNTLLPSLRTGVDASLIVPGETVTVAWELHGLGWSGREEVRYELIFEEAAGGFFHRAGRALRLVGDPWKQQLAWSEPGPDSPGPFLRTARLTLPPEMDPGEYRLRLQVGLAGREIMVTEQRIQVGVPPELMEAAR